MGDHLALMAAHLRLLAEREAAPPKEAGATLLQARAHLDDRTWDRWVTQDVGIPMERAQKWMAVAEAQGASVDTLRPPEL